MEQLESKSTTEHLSKIEVAALSVPITLGTSILFTSSDSKYLPYLAAAALISCFASALYFIPRDRQIKSVR